MRVLVVGSGSSGNSVVFEAPTGERILVDAGINPTLATKRLRSLGHDLLGSPTLAIVVTHHHGDHITHAEPLGRALGAPVYLHGGIDSPRVRQGRAEVREYERGAIFEVGPFVVEARSIPHDAPQVALRIECGGVAFGVCTDLGHVPQDLAELLSRCDAALVEANHCADMLANGPYPDRLKQRVLGHLGHLANDQTAELAASLSGSRLKRIWLGHLSRENNTPEKALGAVRPRARGIDVDVLPHGEPRAVL